MLSIIYLALAAFGLGILIFIHELGHYFMARKVGMKVEAFGIGFGKPIRTWEHKGVKWNLCWLPFGGYVRIAGMEKQGNLEPHQIPDGFYGKRPIDRIKVAIMGPLVNIVFAFLAFTAIWATGGREKPFSEFTHTIGWVDPQSKFYSLGARVGDQITSYNQRPFAGFNDLLYSLLFDNKSAVDVRGYNIDYFAGQKSPFDVTVETTRDPKGLERGITTLGTVKPATYLIYDRYPDGRANALPEGSPMQKSGIKYKDRILWVDGQLIFSQTQLATLLNDGKALLTVQRGKDHLLIRVPRVKVIDMRIPAREKAEFEDWQHAAQLQLRPDQLTFIPYDVTTEGCMVESPITYLDENAEMTNNKTLQSGDRVIAVDGTPVHSGIDMIRELQRKKVQIIVQRDFNRTPFSSSEEDQMFYAGINWKDFQTLTQSIGVSGGVNSLGNLQRLEPIEPRSMSDFPLTPEKKEKTTLKYNQEKEKIAKVENTKEQAQLMRQLEERQKRIMLGIPLQDQMVIYNPSPLVLFVETLDQAWRTLKSLVMGYLSPKLLQGPVGMVQVMQYGWSVGVKEALFWMAVISLNLGILNLLPLPVLDGGHICFALYERVTKKQIKAKTMERMIIPFIVLLVILLIYITYQDLSRLFGNFF